MLSPEVPGLGVLDPLVAPPSSAWNGEAVRSSLDQMYPYLYYIYNYIYVMFMCVLFYTLKISKIKCLKRRIDLIKIAKCHCFTKNGWRCVLLYSAGVPHVAAGVAHGFVTRSGRIGWYRQGEFSAEVEEVLEVEIVIADIAGCCRSCLWSCFIFPDGVMWESCSASTSAQATCCTWRKVYAVSWRCHKTSWTPMSSSKSSSTLDFWESRGFKGQEMARQYKRLKAGIHWNS